MFTTNSFNYDAEYTVTAVDEDTVLINASKESGNITQTERVSRVMKIAYFTSLKASNNEQISKLTANNTKITDLITAITEAV